jgi:hypothetical protein
MNAATLHRIYSHRVAHIGIDRGNRSVVHRYPKICVAKMTRRDAHLPTAIRQLPNDRTAKACLR